MLGVIPYLKDLDLPEEDSLGLEQPRDRHHAAPALDGRSLDVVEVAVIRLPHIANFDEFGPLAAEREVRLRYVERADDLGQPDLAIIPGTKTTIADLDWLRATGLADAVVGLASAGVPLLGICGGYQMLGLTIRDPHGSESDRREAPGLGLVPIETTFATTKRTVRVRGELLASRGPLAGARGSQVVAYEIHMGRTNSFDAVHPLVAIEDRSGEPVMEVDGCVYRDGQVMGTYLHGLLENDAPRHALIDWLQARRRASGRVPGPGFQPARRNLAADRERELDRLAATVRSSLDLRPLLAACGLG
jgi:adenosylcobyric acid synthase